MSNKKNTDNTSEEIDYSLQRKMFGAKLKAARKEADFSYDQVAQNLLLSTDIVKAMESSQVDALPSATFTKGYLRNYARLLGLPPEDIVNEYLKIAPISVAELIPQKPVDKDKEKKLGREQIIKFVSYNIIITLVIVLVFWVFKSNDDDAPPLINTQEFVVDDANKVSPETSVTPADSVQSDGLTNNTPKKASELPEAVIKADKNIEQTKSNNIVLDDNAAPQHQLSWTVSDESWCEIKDATGKRLCYQLLSKGDEKVVSGVPPFNIFFGNARGVHLKLDGKAINYDSLIRKYSKVVRVEISKDGEMKYAPKRKK